MNTAKFDSLMRKIERQRKKCVEAPHDTTLKTLLQKYEDKLNEMIKQEEQEIERMLQNLEYDYED
jgi:fructose-1-phosphate kinase PfkB-like protein